MIIRWRDGMHVDVPGAVSLAVRRQSAGAVLVARVCGRLRPEDGGSANHDATGRGGVPL